ncbi:MAG TPA: alpha/beta fold hydrolase [Gemmatimonadales bacterium]|jgi:pimeloyl-ACP methyl ester carboxylesterase
MLMRVACVLALAAPLTAQAPGLAPEHFTVTVGHEPLAVWARRPAHPKGTILLVHGRTWSALPDFDLQVPGESRSVLSNLAARGYAAYAVDLRGYGGSPRDASGWDTPDQSRDDVAAVLRWMAQTEPMSARPVLLGWSNGSMVSQLVAERYPQLISALILYGYPFAVGEHITVDAPGPLPAREATTDSGARSDFLEPAVTSKRMVDAYSRAALRSDPVRTDWRGALQWNALNPAQVRVPTLLLQGEHDPSLPDSTLARFFSHLGTADKQRVTLLGGDHASLLEDTRPAFIDAVVAFIERRHH